MIGNPAGVLKAASVLGEVIGMAHGNALRAANKQTQVALHAKRAEALDELLCERSKSMHQRMAASYAEFCSDNKVKTLVRQADEFIEKFNKK
jgi:tRNA U34 5-carboxymethylaminomethyl modifying GTPase MnmE/TrmE